MHLRTFLAAATLAAVTLGQAHAAPIALTPDGSWSSFSVESGVAASGGTEWIDLNDGQPISFTFSIDAGFEGLLTVVDGGFAGDTFKLYEHGVLLGSTSAVPVVTYESNPGSVFDDFDAAMADPAYSRGSFLLAAGSYEITGVLGQSVQWAGQDLASTVGGLNVALSPVPEPAALLLLASGMTALSLRRRRAR